MDIEVAEVMDFLASHSPFSELTQAERRSIAAQSRLQYFRRGSTIIDFGAPNSYLYLIRSGAVDIEVDSGLADRDGPGETFGSSSLLSKGPSRYRATAVEDSLVLAIPGSLFEKLHEQSQPLRDYYEPRIRQRLANASRDIGGGDSPLLRLTAGELVQREPVAASPSISIREAARIMTEARVSALLLVDDAGMLEGIVTDRDLRSRVVLAGVDVDKPIAEVMTASPVQIGPEMKAFEILLTMTTRRVHHLPVVSVGKPVGLVSAGDIMRLETSNPVFIVGDIGRKDSVEGVAEVVRRTPDLAVRLLSQDVDSEDVAHVLTTVADTATNRIIQLVTEELGPAPHPWCWLSLGSQARRELGLNSDQDHALILSDEVTDDSWYATMAERVVDGLEAAGYIRCPGDTMSTNWRMTLSGWRRQFSNWISTPDSNAILHSQIFFDARPVAGDPVLFEQLSAHVVPAAQGAQRFLANLAAMAVRREPPLGFFRGFVLEKAGEHKDSFDIKAGGLHAVIESVRVMALAGGIPENGTLARIEALRQAGTINDDQASDLSDAFLLISDLRMRHQAQLHSEGKKPDNFINPDDLAPVQRRHLRDAFGAIRQTQQSLRYKFQTHLMN